MQRNNKEHNNANNLEKNKFAFPRMNKFGYTLHFLLALDLGQNEKLFFVGGDL